MTAPGEAAGGPAPDAPQAKAPILSLALVSAASLGFELSLLRVLAVVGWESLAAQAVGIAMIGAGASGTALFLGGGLPAGASPARLYAVLCAALAASFPLATHLAAAIPYEPFFTDRLGRSGLALAGRVLLLAAPFFLASLLLGLALARHPERGGRLYGANLLGAGLGALSFPPLASLFDPPALVRAYAAAAALGLLAVPGLSGRRRWHLGLAVALGLAAAGKSGWPRLPLSQFKDLAGAALLPGAVIEHPYRGPQGVLSTVSSPALHVAPGLSLQAAEAPPPQVGLFLNGDGYGVVDAVAPGEGPPDYLRFRPEAAAFEMGRAESVLAAGPPGGTGIWLARLHGARRIVALEQVSGVPELADGPLGGFSGMPYHLPGVELHVDVPRSFLATSREAFDLVVLPPAQGFQEAAMGLGSLRENLLYTLEGLEQAAARLAPGGRLVLSAWLTEPPRDGLRLLALAFRTASEDASLHVLAHRSWGQVVAVLLRGQPAPEALAAYEAALERQGCDPVWLPGLGAERANRINVVARPLLYEAARLLAEDPRAPLEPLAGLDASPPSDDRPFFGRFWPASALLEPSARLRQRSSLEWGTLLGALSVAVTAALSAALVLVPLASSGLRRRLGGPAGAARTGVYFAAIGLGYMAVELLFLSRLQLVLHHPAWAASVALAAFLTGSGLGSLASGALLGRGVKPGRIAAAAGLAVAGLAPLLLEALHAAFVPLAALGLGARVAACLLLLAPLAIAMGFLFPAGLGAITHAGAPAGLLPWAYAMNGYTSAVAPGLVALAAPFVGLRALAAAAALLYLVAALGPGGGVRVSGQARAAGALPVTDERRQRPRAACSRNAAEGSRLDGLQHQLDPL